MHAGVVSPPSVYISVRAVHVHTTRYNLLYAPAGDCTGTREEFQIFVDFPFQGNTEVDRASDGVVFVLFEVFSLLAGDSYQLHRCTNVQRCVLAIYLYCTATVILRISISSLFQSFRVVWNFTFCRWFGEIDDVTKRSDLPFRVRFFSFTVA